MVRAGRTTGTVLHNGYIGTIVSSTNVKGTMYTGMKRWNGATEWLCGNDSSGQKCNEYCVYRNDEVERDYRMVIRER